MITLRMLCFGVGQLAFDKEAVPTLALIGIDKGGTSEAFVQLALRGFGASETKELCCLCRASFLQVYRCYDEAFNLSFTGQLTVDATPRYLYHHAVADRMAAFSPSTTILVMLREPLSRIQSLYNHWQTTGKIAVNTSIPLQEHLQLEFAFLSSKETRASVSALFNSSSVDAFEVLQSLRSRIHSCTRSMGIAACTKARHWQDTYKSSVRPYSYLLSSLYDVCLRKWSTTMLHPSRPGKFAVVQSEAFFANESHLLDLIEIPDWHVQRKQLHVNKGDFHHEYSDAAALSRSLAMRLRNWLEKPRLSLLSHLHEMSSMGALVVPSMHTAGNWWAKKWDSSHICAPPEADSICRKCACK
ncbi:hypothetical protein AB1Y20_017092 [Prymnesium parvum]|uniref:Protein-tyrosine sulfotransferase n=1 Tax=Prymnesium parvum TaxID=97485 RepID=A0AB34ICB8_PRYPA